jgi:hypothetical protein
MAQGRYHSTPMKDGESHDAYERRTWIERAHINDDGYVIVPMYATKNMMSEAAKFRSLKKKGQQTYTKHLVSGVRPTRDMVLNVEKGDIIQYPMYVPSDGKRGGSKRVQKFFPVIREWQGEANWLITDPEITEEVFLFTLETAGRSIGLGSFRFANNGVFGGFSVESFLFEDE